MNARSFVAARTSALSGGSALFSVLYTVACKARTLVRTLRNRIVAHKLEEFSDHQLNDIGLTREDLGFALSKPLTVDPTIEFARCARSNIRRQADYSH
ncbi:DUF1127 domain-containing protein [Hoeflea sp.]|uniref:DUF1127 domain-containing protein n=1 Tax=Hoeflea sp. TaxID=1940281 RepID=UPI003748BAFB